MRIVPALIACLVAAPAVLAGEYGLSVSSSFPHPCERELTHTLNSCTPAAVAEDLRGYFIAGKPFRIKAVEMAVLSGSISLAPDALATFNDTIAAICVSDSSHHFDTLERLLHFLPYKTLRRRLASELRVTRQPGARARLKKALAALP